MCNDMFDRPEQRLTKFGLLRPMTDADLERVLAWRNHPAVRAHMYTQHEITVEEHRTWWVGAKDTAKSRFLIYEQAGQPMGYVAFSDIARGSDTATWGFYTAPHAAKGTGSLMTFCAMDLAFGSLDLRKLNAEVVGRNAASLNLHANFGFIREGLFRDHVKIGDALDDVHCLALFAENWAALRADKLKTLTERLSQ